jgi:hypothetical protein
MLLTKPFEVDKTVKVLNRFNQVVVELQLPE